MDHKSQYTKSYLHNRDWVHTVNRTVLKLPASQTITARQPENDSAHAHMDVHTHTLKRWTKKNKVPLALSIGRIEAEKLIHTVTMRDKQCIIL